MLLPISKIKCLNSLSANSNPIFILSTIFLSKVRFVVKILPFITFSFTSQLDEILLWATDPAISFLRFPFTSHLKTVESCNKYFVNFPDNSNFPI